MERFAHSVCTRSVSEREAESCVLREKGVKVAGMSGPLSRERLEIQSL